MKTLKYIELKSGYSDNGPAWIGYVTPSKTGRTLYFSGRALRKRKEQRGDYFDVETRELFWISNVKKNGEDRHWAGTGKVLIEAAAVPEYLKTIGASALDKSRLKVTHSILPTDIAKFERIANTSLYDDKLGGDESAAES